MCWQVGLKGFLVIKTREALEIVLVDESTQEWRIDDGSKAWNNEDVNTELLPKENMAARVRVRKTVMDLHGEALRQILEERVEKKIENWRIEEEVDDNVDVSNPSP